MFTAWTQWKTENSPREVLRDKNAEKKSFAESRHSEKWNASARISAPINEIVIFE
jgi:hypothetical protein